MDDTISRYSDVPGSQFSMILSSLDDVDPVAKTKGTKVVTKATNKVKGASSLENTSPASQQETASPPKIEEDHSDAAKGVCDKQSSSSKTQPKQPPEQTVVNEGQTEQQGNSPKELVKATEAVKSGPKETPFTDTPGRRSQSTKQDPLIAPDSTDGKTGHSKHHGEDHTDGTASDASKYTGTLENDSVHDHCSDPSQPSDDHGMAKAATAPDTSTLKQVDNDNSTRPTDGLLSTDTPTPEQSTEEGTPDGTYDSTKKQDTEKLTQYTAHVYSVTGESAQKSSSDIEHPAQREGILYEDQKEIHDQVSKGGIFEKRDDHSAGTAGDMGNDADMKDTPMQKGNVEKQQPDGKENHHGDTTVSTKSSSHQPPEEENPGGHSAAATRSSAHQRTEEEKPQGNTASSVKSSPHQQGRGDCFYQEVWDAILAPENCVLMLLCLFVLWFIFRTSSFGNVAYTIGLFVVVITMHVLLRIWVKGPL